MTDAPDQIWELSEGMEVEYLSRAYVARLLAEERERCARIAEGHSESPGSPYRTWSFMQGGNRSEDSDVAWFAKAIAAAIRGENND